MTAYRLFFLGVTVTCDRCEQADVLIVSPLQPLSWKPRGLRCVSLLVEGGDATGTLPSSPTSLPITSLNVIVVN